MEAAMKFMLINFSVKWTEKPLLLVPFLLPYRYLLLFLLLIEFRFRTLAFIQVQVLLLIVTLAIDRMLPKVVPTLRATMFHTGILRMQSWLSNFRMKSLPDSTVGGTTHKTNPLTVVLVLVLVLVPCLMTTHRQGGPTMWKHNASFHNNWQMLNWHRVWQEENKKRLYVVIANNGLSWRTSQSGTNASFLCSLLRLPLQFRYSLSLGSFRRTMYHSLTDLEMTGSTRILGAMLDPSMSMNRVTPAFPSGTVPFDGQTMAKAWT
mmetsp:Transcript_42794/g.103512  ORF Transcript_42794/g.103512 Transcript_42794/m.103512 type:complete len:263 (+) Transcript_42794:521-1309(+)